jgi:hypothetical protein
MKTSKMDAPDAFEMEGYEGHFAELGGYTVGFEAYTDDSDPSALFEGLPDDHCQCSHWGVVLKGKLTYRYSDGTEETIGEGEAYYARPGHLPYLHAGTEVIEFSPTTELGQTMEVIERNMAVSSS